MTLWREDSGPALQPQSDYAQTPECQPSLTNWKIVQRPTTVVWVAIPVKVCAACRWSGSLESPASFLDACGLAGSCRTRAQTSLLMAADRCCRANCLDAFFKTKLAQKAAVRALSFHFSGLPFFSFVRGPDRKSIQSLVQVVPQSPGQWLTATENWQLVS